MSKKAKNKAALSWIGGRIKKFIPEITLISLISGVTSVSFVALALVSRDVIDIATGSKSGGLAKSGLLLFAIIIGQIILSAVSSVIKARVSGRMTISMRNSLFSGIVKKKYPNISSRHSGDILNRLTSDTEVIVSGAVSIIPAVVSTFAKIIAGIGALFFLNRTFALIILVLGITVPAIGRAINRKFKYLHKECQRSEGVTRSFLQECFENVIVIKSFISEKPFLKKLNRSMDENYRYKMKRNGVSVFANMSLYSFFTVGYYTVLLWSAGLISNGSISYGTLTAFLQLISQLRAPLQNISGILPQYYSAIASAERLMELVAGEDEHTPLTGEGLDSLKNEFKTINATGVNFAYDGEEVLSDCTLTLERGKITAITGESGCGKSTLFKLLLGLYEPQSGSITINGNIPVGAATRGLFAYVPQGNLILSGTIRENLTLCDDGISDAAVEEAAKAAEIYDYIVSLPDGFETVISERGTGLSEGQLQRIAIARALLYDAPVLLLDESTSALDEQTETRLLSNIKALPDKTVIFITHRNTSISVCDRIIHVENKRFCKIK